MPTPSSQSIQGLQTLEGLMEFMRALPPDMIAAGGSAALQGMALQAFLSGKTNKELANDFRAWRSGNGESLAKLQTFLQAVCTLP